MLEPKLRSPLPRPEQLVRRGLLEILHDALYYKVSVVSAPTGYGKSTLLAHWRRVEEGDTLFAWVSVDEQDNDLIRLWRHTVEALRRVVPEVEDFGTNVLARMSAMGKRFVGAALSTLVNEVAELPHRVVLVLDDYQFVTELHELQRLWLIEATRYNVIPLDDRAAERLDPARAGRPQLVRGDTQVFFPGMRRISEASVLNLKNKSFSVTAQIVVPDGPLDGVIIAQGQKMGGWSFYVKEGKTKFVYNASGVRLFTTEAGETVPPGEHQVRAEFAYNVRVLAPECLPLQEPCAQVKMELQGRSHQGQRPHRRGHLGHRGAYVSKHGGDR